MYELDLTLQENIKKRFQKDGMCTGMVPHLTAESYNWKMVNVS